MSSGHLKITDEKVVFNHTKSGRKDTIKGADIELVNWQRLAGVWGIRMFTKDGALHRLVWWIHFGVGLYVSQNNLGLLGLKSQKEKG